MSTITRNNYEAYLLDYVEENLSPELIAELMLFLENNPDLKNELEDFELLELTSPAIELVNKEELKKEEESITLYNYEDYLIGEVEGENSPEISKELHSFLKENPQKEKEFSLYQKTRLNASSIIFDHKASLKKKEGKVIPLYWWYASAAAVVLIFFLLRGLNADEKKNDLPLAEEKEQVTPQQEEIMVNEHQEEQNNDVNVLASEDKIIKREHTMRVKPKNKTNIITPDVTPGKEKDQEIELAVNKEEKTKDTVRVNEPEIPEQEEVQYADNVRITYEDDENDSKDELADVGMEKEHKTKFDVVKAIINQQVKKKFLQPKDNGSGVETYAVNIGMLGFGKNKKKKEN